VGSRGVPERKEASIRRSGIRELEVEVDVEVEVEQVISVPITLLTRCDRGLRRREGREGPGGMHWLLKINETDSDVESKIHRGTPTSSSSISVFLSLVKIEYFSCLYGLS
jgi:hypothetical protein